MSCVLSEDSFKMCIRDRVKGRHDPVIVNRAVVVVESMVALTVLDGLLANMSATMDGIENFYR